MVFVKEEQLLPRVMEPVRQLEPEKARNTCRSPEMKPSYKKYLTLAVTESSSA